MKEIERLFFQSMRDGVFEIDDEGRIWRIGRYSRTENILPWPRERAEVPTGHSTSLHRYLAVMVRMRKYKSRKAMAHRLVWIHTHGDIDNALEVNHKDLIKDHNLPSNLELANRSQNMKHAFKHGSIPYMTANIGDNHVNAKLNHKQVKRIKELNRSGLATVKEMSAMFIVSTSAIRSVLNGRTWKDVE